MAILRRVNLYHTSFVSIVKHAFSMQVKNKHTHPFVNDYKMLILLLFTLFIQFSMINLQHTNK